MWPNGRGVAYHKEENVKTDMEKVGEVDNWARRKARIRIELAVHVYSG